MLREDAAQTVHKVVQPCNPSIGAQSRKVPGTFWPPISQVEAAP